MKELFKTIIFGLFVFSVSSCYTYYSHPKEYRIQKSFVQFMAKERK